MSGSPLSIRRALVVLAPFINGHGGAAGARNQRTGGDGPVFRERRPSIAMARLVKGSGPSLRRGGARRDRCAGVRRTQRGRRVQRGPDPEWERRVLVRSFRISPPWARLRADSGNLTHARRKQVLREQMVLVLAVSPVGPLSDSARPPKLPGQHRPSTKGVTGLTRTASLLE
jgi:hypothetical protein